MEVVVKRAMLLVVIAVLSGCALRSQSEATPIDRENIPFGLLDTTTSSTPDATSTTAAAGPLNVFFIRADRLAQVDRSVAGGPTLDNALSALQSQPTTEEEAAGLRNAIPPGQLQSFSQENDLVTVNLSQDFSEVSGAEQTRALAQIVFTVTAVPGIAQVRFFLAGNAVEVPRGDGTLTAAPVTRTDYANLAPL